MDLKFKQHQDSLNRNKSLNLTNTLNSFGLNISAQTKPNCLAQFNSLAPQTQSEITVSKFRPQTSKYTNLQPKLKQINQYKKTFSEFTSNLTAAVTGAISFGLVTQAEISPLRLLALPLAASSGAITNYLVKDGLEHLLLPKNQVNLSQSDLWVGALDGLSGVVAGLCDQKIARNYINYLGKDALGNEASAAEINFAGKTLTNENLLPKFKLNALRGFSGGASGSLAFSLPYELVDNYQQIKTHPLTNLPKTLSVVAQNTLIGGIAGGTIGVIASAIANAPDLITNIKAKTMQGDSLTKINYLHINDFHSSLEKLPAMDTTIAKLQAKAGSIPSKFVVAGDVESGNLNFTFTDGGKVENAALAKMGADTIIPGNHPYDHPSGGFVPERYPKVMEPILKANPKLKLIAANLDLTAYPDYEKLTAPYVVRQIETAHGSEQIAELGLITKEGAVGKIGYLDASDTATKYIKELNAQGINKIVIISHLGLNEDMQLAQNLNAQNLKVAAIIGGHTHDVTPTPIWIKNDGNEIPIVQAGSKGKWLGELNLNINSDGSANKNLTSGRMHPINQDNQPSKEMQNFIDNSLTQAKSLKNEKYNTTLTKPISLDGIRSQETRLGHIIADSIYQYVKNESDYNPDLVIIQSGSIRDGLPGLKDLSRFDLAKIFMHSGDLQTETHQLIGLDMTGAQIKQALEYGVRDIPNPGSKTSFTKFSELFSNHFSTSKFDESGNFNHPSQLRYKIDLSKPGAVSREFSGNRITDLTIDKGNGKIQPIQDNQTYKVVTRFHPLAKWHKFGVFGDLSIDNIKEQSHLEVIKLSQVDALANFLKTRGFTDPERLLPLDGRIAYITQPQYANTGSAIHVGSSMIGIPLTNITKN